MSNSAEVIYGIGGKVGDIGSEISISGIRIVVYCGIFKISACPVLEPSFYIISTVQIASVYQTIDGGTRAGYVVCVSCRYTYRSVIIVISITVIVILRVGRNGRKDKKSNC